MEEQFEIVFSTREKAAIPIAGLFLNADVGFDAKNYRESCSKKEINANMCFNKPNANLDSDIGTTIFDKELYIKSMT